MQFNSKTILCVLAAALLLVATSAPALTLGRLRGSVLLGKGLDVAVAVQTAADEDRSATCFDADVSYGDTPLERSLVKVSVQPGPQTNSQTVHISSALKVDEAVVSLTLRAGCGAQAARRYVLLSEVLSEVITTPATLSAVASPATPEQLPVKTQPRASIPASAADPVPAKPTKAAPVAKSAGEGGRLKLSSLASGPAHEAAPQAARTVSIAVIAELQQRVEDVERAQAANASVPLSLQNETRAIALQADIDSLRLATVKNQANLQALVAALDGAPSQAFGRPLVLVLAALLAVCVALLSFLVLRLRNGGFAAVPWWSGGADRVAPLHSGNPSASVAMAPAAQTQVEPAANQVKAASGAADQAAATGPVGIQSQPIELDADTVRSTVVMDIRTATRPAPIPQDALSPRSSQPAFSPSNHGVSKAINTREMLDVRQQAEFFMALGQHDEAVGLLESNIRDSADSNPLVFLDLLKILHTLSRRGDFERYRQDFNLQFTGRALDFAHFLSEGNGLEAYEDICQQIVVLWPTEYTIDFIEQCLVRTPEDDPEQGIDLDAFKDLLFLYGVLKRLEQADESADRPFSASRTVSGIDGLRQENASASPRPSELTVPAPPMPTVELPAGVDLDLDLDLSLDPDEELDIDLDLDFTDDQAGKQNNLIDFDMPGYVKPAPGQAPKP